MASRPRQHDLPAGWDPMRAEYESSTYGAQNPDDEASDCGRLDHCRLHVKNVPPLLSEDGLRSLFGKFGRLTESFLSGDPNKRYGLIRYESPGEAKLAMEKLNRVEPWKLQINIAYKNRTKQQTNGSNNSNSYNAAPRQSLGQRLNSSRSHNQQPRLRVELAEVDQYEDFNDTLSSSSKGRMSSRQDMAQERISDEDRFSDVMNYLKELGQIDSEDPDLECELENLKLQGAALLYKQRLKALKAAEEKKSQRSSNVGSRCFLPDGKIVVHNDMTYDTNDKLKRDLESNVGAAGGDSSSIPGLRESRSTYCVDCGSTAQFYCARCEVTPYCSDLCQRRDWPRRHKAVCHNLARLSNPPRDASINATAEEIKALPPLRRPRSPAASTGAIRRDDVQAKSANAGPSAGLTNGHQSQGFTKKPFNNENSSSRTSNFKHERQSNNFDGKRNDNRAVNGRAPDNYRQPSDNSRQPSDNNRHFNTNRQFNDNKRPNDNRGQGGRLANNIANDDEQEWAPKKESQPSSTAPQEVKTVDPAIVAKLSSPVAATPVKRAVKLAKPLANIKPLVPAKCLMDLLEVGSTIVLSVDFPASSCRVDNGIGFLCLSMHEDFQSNYENLCEAYAEDCAKLAKGFKPAPGDLFSLFVDEDQAWYRARLLSGEDYSCALIDSGVICEAKPDNIREVPDRYIGLPEFCCLLIGEGVSLEDRFLANIERKSPDGECSVSLTDGSTVLGKAILKRWLPTVQYPPPPATPPATDPTTNTPPTSAAAQSIPSVPRPELKDNTEVCLVHIAATDNLTVRSTDASVKRAFDAIEQGVAFEGKKALQLKEPPKAGEVVLLKQTDGVHYRGLVMRTNVKQNKYLVELVEAGTTEIATLENLYVCPSEYRLEQSPAVSSKLSLHDVSDALSKPATEYAWKLAHSAHPLVLTLPNDVKSAPSGSAAILNSNKENINKRISDMCKPDWKKLEEKGGDVLESEVLLSNQLEYLPIKSGEELKILDSSLQHEGCLSVCASDEKTLEHMAYVLGPLTERITEYCDSKLGRDPYLPRDEELCIAKCPPFDTWFRALKCEAPDGVGSDNICVLYIDYGNIGNVSARDLRKMLPEFVRGVPALATTIVIQDFPEKPSSALMSKIRSVLGTEDDSAGGSITVTNLTEISPGYYNAVVPALSALFKSNQ